MVTVPNPTRESHIAAMLTKHSIVCRLKIDSLIAGVGRCVFRCKICSADFSDTEVIREHVEREHDGAEEGADDAVLPVKMAVWKCGECSKRIISEKSSIERHLVGSHGAHSLKQFVRERLPPSEDAAEVLETITRVFKTNSDMKEADRSVAEAKTPIQGAVTRPRLLKKADNKDEKSPQKSLLKESNNNLAEKKKNPSKSKKHLKAKVSTSDVVTPPGVFPGSGCLYRCSLCEFEAGDRNRFRAHYAGKHRARGEDAWTDGYETVREANLACPECGELVIDERTQVANHMYFKHNLKASEWKKKYYFSDETSRKEEQDSPAQTEKSREEASAKSGDKEPTEDSESSSNSEMSVPAPAPDPTEVECSPRPPKRIKRLLPFAKREDACFLVKKVKKIKTLMPELAASDNENQEPSSEEEDFGDASDADVEVGGGCKYRCKNCTYETDDSFYVRFHFKTHHGGPGATTKKGAWRDSYVALKEAKVNCKICGVSVADEKSQIKAHLAHKHDKVSLREYVHGKMGANVANVKKKKRVLKPTIAVRKKEEGAKSPAKINVKQWWSGCKYR